MTKLLFFILSLTLQGFAEPDLLAIEACGNTLGDCQFYECISEYRNCGVQHYPRAFGKPYCDRFWNDQINYSVKGQSVLQSLRLCLQEDLLISQHTVSCSQMRQLAFSQHIRCYLASGFCDLPKKDKVRLLRTITVELRHKDFIATAWRIEKSCFQINRN